MTGDIWANCGVGIIMVMAWQLQAKERQLLVTFGLSSLVSVGLFTLRVLASQNTRYWFLLWNLALAWLPMLFAWWLVKRLQRQAWPSWQNVLLTALWLGFLPNSFYIASDLIHLRSTGEVSQLFDIVMFVSFTWNGFLLGFTSLFFVHQQLLARLKAANAHATVAVVLLLCSFAIYLGRYLRWNTWDVLINPAGLLFDVSDRLIYPTAHPQTFTTTASFFVLLSSMYVVVWQLIHIFREPRFQ